MRILIAGFQHETNTFAPSRADYDNFVRGEGFPAMSRGDAMLALRDVNIPAGGFIAEAQAQGHALLPVVWAAASPSAHVTRAAYERIAGEITDAAARLAPDAIYLDLHGAMVAEHIDDGEGELLSRLREIVGPRVPIVASLDLHANVTERMLAMADALVAYRTYPHVDMADTGRACARLLSRIAGGQRLARISRRLPFLIPVNAMCTLMAPAKQIYERIAGLEATTPVASMSFTPGFPAADFPGCGPVVWGYAEDANVARVTVDALYAAVADDEGAWAIDLLSPDAAVREAMRIAANAARPVVIADTQDNPFGGADANTTGMLRALIDNGATDAALGLLYDPAVAALAHEAGVGATITCALGGHSGVAGDAPLEASFEVAYLSDGRCVFEGPMMTGSRVDVGPTACLRIGGAGGISVVVSSAKTSMNDRNLFRMAGIEPERMKILVNKSSVHFRADFGPIAEAILVAKAPGPMAADPADLPWTSLACGMRLKPNGAAFRAAQSSQGPQ
ncbi:M81 family metallopeptidase [Cupriavidus pauculus]|uniref:Microcystinase C n=1 Tax=Cupriavidus pauculus TaxID=82633 RepID=A0A5P2HEH4_9BURK|nr:M81 family metallopeptidase [Cupriavidus pauculus]QET06641.1 M81 family metallopeptidase [Cupriavidus pauculus]